MAFISTGYDPKNPMVNRITDIGPKDFNEFYPPVIAKNKGKWSHHEILEPGVLRKEPAREFRIISVSAAFSPRR